MKELEEFFLSSNKELISTVNRLDDLIGNKHWLTVGTYKETLLKKLLRRVIPDKYSISSGFVVAAGYENNIINSSQTDILIWDSCNYSPLFRDGDFVIIPPESCKIMIEVKGVLTKKEIQKSIYNFDKLIALRSVEYLQTYNISKYIFAYEIKNLNYPNGVFNALTDTYNYCTYLPLKDRLDSMKESFSSSNGGYCPLFKINGIYILTKGFVHCSEKLMKDDKLKLLFSSYSVTKKDESNVYSIFETEILSQLDTFGGFQSHFWSKQPGLFSLRKHLKMPFSSPYSVLVLPETDYQYYNEDLTESMVYKRSCSKKEDDTL